MPSVSAPRAHPEMTFDTPNLACTASSLTNTAEQSEKSRPPQTSTRIIRPSSQSFARILFFRQRMIRRSGCMQNIRRQPKRRRTEIRRGGSGADKVPVRESPVTPGGRRLPRRSRQIVRMSGVWCVLPWAHAHAFTISGGTFVGGRPIQQAQQLPLRRPEYLDVGYKPDIRYRWNTL